MYGRNPALRGVNLSIPRGRIIGLLGPNGSGKSTLIKLMCGLLQPTAGSVLIDGFAPGVETKKRISYLPERTYLTSSRRISDLLDYFNDFYDNFDPKRALSMLDSLQIDKNAAMKSLSKGTKEKVQLVLVMSRDTDLYILDEPIAGVDPAARDYILKTIISNYNENASILLSTHLISDIEAVLDDVIFIRDGQLLLYSSVEDIRSNYGKSIDGYFREVFAC
jgi:ABC-2 type transport system ATP-binding protein